LIVGNFDIDGCIVGKEGDVSPEIVGDVIDEDKEKDRSEDTTLWYSRVYLPNVRIFATNACALLSP
jgi:hypothetical protein